ncbi:MAG: hypothetical protein D6707_06985 [Bacteroidetes bacterium]|nr:MAG: hypothetical protein D6707_06985 [Bacteroidota bacterium]
MKKSIFTLLFFIALWGCDKIDDPYQDYVPSAPTANTNNDSTSELLVDTTDQTQRVFIEDYTGHTCGNCTGAGYTARQLKQTYGDKMIVVGIHAGFFAEPYPPSAGKYTTDFRTAAGDEYYTFFNVQSNPTIWFDRENVLTSSTQAPWEAEIINRTSKNARVQLGLKIEYDSTSNTAQIELGAYFFDNIDSSLYVTLSLIEDSIVDWQKNYASGGDPDYPVGDVPDYVHRHVLRDNVNGIWGEQLAANAQKGDLFTKQYTYTPTNYLDIKHCSIVAYIYNNDHPTRKVLQVTEKHLITH